MLKTIDHITLMADNFDRIRFDASDLVSFHICGISEHAKSFANQIEFFNGFDKVEISIHKDADVEYSSESYGDEYTVFERLLKVRDISIISIVYNDGSEDEFVAPWKEPLGDKKSNAFQESVIDQNGNLYIQIDTHDRVDMEY